MVANYLYPMGRIQARLGFPHQLRVDPVLVDSKLETQSAVSGLQLALGDSRERNLLSILDGQWTLKMGRMVEPMIPNLACL